MEEYNGGGVTTDNQGNMCGGVEDCK
jgi:hypothetical protein